MAFANTAGGTLLLGVEDKSRHVLGVGDPLDLEERLANLISDLVTPRLVPELEILPWRRTQVLAVQVYPNPSRPHYLKRDGPKAAANRAKHEVTFEEASTVFADPLGRITDDNAP